MAHLLLLLQKVSPLESKEKTVLKTASVNRAAYKKQISQVPSKTIKSDYAVDSTPDTLTGLMADTSATVEGIIQEVKADYRPNSSMVTSTYSVYIQKVYAGDKHLVGQTLTLTAFGASPEIKTFIMIISKRTIFQRMKN